MSIFNVVADKCSYGITGIEKAKIQYLHFGYFFGTKLIQKKIIYNKTNKKLGITSRLCNPLFHEHVINLVDFTRFNFEQVMGIRSFSDIAAEDFN